MSNKHSKKAPHQQIVQQKPTTTNPIKLVKLFCVCVGAACAISAAICTFWKILLPDTTGQKICFVIAALCIYVYGGLDTEAKCKNWGLIN